MSAPMPHRDRVLMGPGPSNPYPEVIVGGSAILVAIMRGLRIDPLLVSERDILDGVVADLLDQP